MIYLVRHTRVNVASGICYGQSNVDVADSFLEEAEKVKKQLQSLNFSKVYTSPLDRCTLLASYCGYPDAIKSDALMELNFGDWEGEKWDNLDMSIWSDDWVNNPPPNGESFADMYKRTSKFFSKLADDNVLIFTHKGVINCAKSYFKGISLKATFDEATNYGEIIVMR